MEANPWSTSTWINEPDRWRVDGEILVVDTGLETDFWRHTAYSFIHDSGHALVSDFPTNTSLELGVEADYSHDFDQAGIMVWADQEHWVFLGANLVDRANLTRGGVRCGGFAETLRSRRKGWLWRDAHRGNGERQGSRKDECQTTRALVVSPGL